MLVDSQGQRIDKGPLAIVSDPVQKDRTVVNGLSCMSCHVAGMIRKQDEVTEHVEKNRASFTAREVESFYAGSSSRSSKSFHPSNTTALSNLSL